jgi:hypothetical protein
MTTNLLDHAESLTTNLLDHANLSLIIEVNLFEYINNDSRNPYEQWSKALCRRDIGIGSCRHVGVLVLVAIGQ